MAQLDDEEAIMPISKEVKNKFMIGMVDKVGKELGKETNFITDNVNNVKTAFVICDDDNDAKFVFEQIKKSQLKIINEFIEIELNDNPSKYNRSFIYESEIKDGNLIIRWDG